ncbi:TonB-dependent receptor [Rhabdobacter roseus]|uniref:Outer membrane receptor protein involved in Fe transport n=1 Tax=Rhabdobacter roseus TaxID=1655419 RepID=A0A840U015_9BACT|nr:TonB-dependent receptor [Rhabdobacter roseus]MBB5285229.1 outer membrane receptor protein involved in Fe transport [Rhabdobacter roseus]
MKKSLLLLLCSFISYNLLAQNASLRGFVLDQSTRKPLAGAVVQLDGAPERVRVTNELGEFRFANLPSQEYALTVTFVGFEVLRQTVRPQEASQEFFLTASLVALEAVTVQSQKAHQRQLISPIDIGLRPIMNSQEVLRQVPGLFIGQHAGGGKAEQIFLRGFDIDHGTDVRLTADGLPVNMVSHAHGQGYADLHFIIPELIESVAFKKGTYSAEHGNFSTAGWVDFRTRDVLDRSFVKAEVGQFDTYRVLGAFDLLGEKAKQRSQSAYLATEYNFSNSYFDSPQHFNRLNVLGKYNGQLSPSTYLNAAFSTFWSRWNHSGQIPDRAVADGRISHYGAIDDTEGGETSRTNVNLQFLTLTPQGGVWKNQVFYSHYNFELFSNFTFFLENPIDGDQIKQYERRNLFGYNGSYSRPHTLEGKTGELVVGVNYRHDLTRDTELSQTRNRAEVLERLMYGDINEANLGVYVEENLSLGRYFSLNAGLRYDVFRNQYADHLSGEIGVASAGILLPKLNLYYTPSTSVQLYLNTGKSFHSNDTRVVVPQNGREVLPPAYGSDLGVNWKPFPRLLLNAAAWYLWLDQEFVYVGDAGVVEPSGQTRRQGLDLSARYQLTSRLYFDADLNWAQPRAIGEEPGTDRIPLAPVFTSVGGLTFQGRQGFSGSLRYRYMADRPANEDNSLVAQGYFISDLQLNYTQKRYALGLSINNLLNTKWKETQFATVSRLRNEPEPVEEIHFTAGSPFFARLAFTYFLR